MILQSPCTVEYMEIFFCGLDFRLLLSKININFRTVDSKLLDLKIEFWNSLSDEIRIVVIVGREGGERTRQWLSIAHCSFGIFKIA